MKKILLGVASLGLASLALAGGVDPTKDPKEGTNVFTNDQKGSLPIEGKLLKAPEPPKTKYVVFAQGGMSSEMQDVLKLADFVVSGDPDKARFEGLNPMVGVRRVENGEMVPLENEKVEFSIHNKTVKNLVGLKSLEGRVVKEGESIRYDIYQLMNETDIIRVMKSLNDKHSLKGEEIGYRINEQGVLIYSDDKSANEQEYHLGKTVEFINKGSGMMLIAAGGALDAKVPMIEELQKEVSEALVDVAASIDGGSEMVIYIK